MLSCRTHKMTELPPEVLPQNGVEFSGPVSVSPGGGMTEAYEWKRPESVPIPTVWARFESKKPMPNGRTPKFRIQDFAEEWREQVTHNMVSYFLRDEPLCRSLNLTKDPFAVEEFKKLFTEFLDRKMVLVAIVENLEELGDDTLPALAGCNITGIVTFTEKVKTSKSDKMQKILDVLEELEMKKNVFEYYQVQELMYALGLSVDPAFRGHGLGEEILKARFPLCKAVGVKATVTVFTAGAAQRSAEKAGFETLAEIAYDDYKDDSGKVVFRVDQPKSLKMMGIRIQ